MTDQTRRVTIDAPDGPTILAARHLDATEGPVQVGATVTTATRSAIDHVLGYVAKAHNGSAATADTAATEATERPKCDCMMRSDHTLKCASGLSVGVRRVNRLGELIEDDPDEGVTIRSSINEHCACCGGGPMIPQTGNRTPDGRALCIPCAKGTCVCGRTSRQRWTDALLHRGPGYDLTVPRFTARPVTPEMEAAATARARQAAADSEKAAAWYSKHCAPDARYDQLQQRVHELEALASDTDRLHTDWTTMRDRAETAEATLREVLDAFEAYWARASYCGPGQSAVQPEHFQGWRNVLKQPKEPRPVTSPQWNGEPCTARQITAIVADNTAFPGYWARPFVGMRRKIVEVTYGGSTFYLDDEAGEGWHKVTHGGSPWFPHSNLSIEPNSVEPRNAEPKEPR